MAITAWNKAIMVNADQNQNIKHLKKKFEKWKYFPGWALTLIYFSQADYLIFADRCWSDLEKVACQHAFLIKTYFSIWLQVAKFSTTGFLEWKVSNCCEVRGFCVYFHRKQNNITYLIYFLVGWLIQYPLQVWLIVEWNPIKVVPILLISNLGT